MELLPDIEKLIAWYDKNGAKADITQLLDCQDKLAVRSYRWAEYTAELKTEYNHAYLIRRIAISKKKNALVKKGSGIGAAESQALEENEESYQNELEMEAAAMRGDMLLRQLNKVLDAIRQRISWLKKEEESVKTQDSP